MGDTWYWCVNCGCSFPGSEMSSHRGHRTWQTGEETEESNQDEKDD